MSHTSAQYLSFYDKNVLIIRDVDKSGSVIMGLARETCPSCGLEDCFNDCDGSQGADENNTESEEDALGRHCVNAGLHTLESFLLSLVCAGVITESEDPRVNEAIETCLDALGNRY
jgi:hypothetical protein